jgi:hypothetical protein
MAAGIRSNVMGNLTTFPDWHLFNVSVGDMLSIKFTAISAVRICPFFFFFCICICCIGEHIWEGGLGKAVFSKCFVDFCYFAMRMRMQALK